MSCLSATSRILQCVLRGFQGLARYSNEGVSAVMLSRGWRLIRAPSLISAPTVLLFNPNGVDNKRDLPTLQRLDGSNSRSVFLRKLFSLVDNHPCHIPRSKASGCGEYHESFSGNWKLCIGVQ